MCSSDLIWETYEKNHKETFLDKRSITKITSNEVPECTGIIGGPPCQSWSTGGKGLGKLDPRGKVFFEFIRVLKDKHPLFFVVENVAGMLADRHKEAFSEIKAEFENAGYNVSIGLLNTSDFNVPQDRVRFFFVGYRNDLNKTFKFPRKSPNHLTTKDAIWDLRNNAIPSLPLNKTNGSNCKIPNHEYWLGSYSYIFMSRNRVLSWDKPSYTIQASGRQVSIHPQAPKMIKVVRDVMKFDTEKAHLYRRLTVRECARLQTFPDDFIFYYNNLEHGHKMIGNAVPVNLSFAIAKKINKDLHEFIKTQSKNSIKTKNGFITTKQRSDLMKKIKASGTKPEVFLREKINTLGYKTVINVKEIIGTPDIVIPEKKVAVFVDGEFWHGYNWKEKKKKIKRNKNYWLLKIENNIRRDKKNNLRLRKLGYKVLRFWENDIKKDIDKCISKILLHIEK